MQNVTAVNHECFTVLMIAAYHIQHGNTGVAREHLVNLL